MKIFLYFCVFSFVVLNSCNASNQSLQTDWKQQIETIDQEIAGLTKQENEIRYQANQAERNSLIYMRDDWDKYSKIMEQVEKDHKTIEALEIKLQELNNEKQKILDAHKDEIRS